MASATEKDQLFSLQLIILPIIHIVLFVMAALVSLRSPYGLSAVFFVDLPISFPLFSSDAWSTLLVVAVLSTGWWYFIGRIGWVSHKRRISRISSGLGAALILFICGSDVILILGQVAGWHDDERFSLSVIAVYVVAGVLLAGGFASGVVSGIAAFKSRETR